MADKSQKASLVLCVGIALVILAGCSDHESNTLVGVGSATPVLAMQEWEKLLASQGTSISYRSNGEKAGAEEFLEGSADFLLTTLGAANDKNQAFTEARQSIVSLPILRADIALVHTQRGCDMALTREEARLIFTGDITNFYSFGCERTPITVLTREEHSGTRQNVYKYLGLNTMSNSQKSDVKAATIVAPNIENVINAIPGAIGYIPGPLISFDNVFPIKIKGKGDTVYSPVLGVQKSNIDKENKSNKDDNKPNASYDYPIRSTIYLVVKKNGQRRKMAALQRFARFSVSETAQSSAESMGYIKLTPSQRRLAEEKVKTFID